MPNNVAKQNPVRVAQLAPELIDRLLADVERYVTEANNIDFSTTRKLDIRYGEPEIEATGYVPIALAELLVKQGLLKETISDDKDDLTKSKVRLSLNIPEPLTKSQVNAHIKKIERFCSQHIAEYVDERPRMLARLRGERLPLCNKLADVHVKKGNYASYDRGMDILGFNVHASHVIPLLEDIHSQFVYAGVVLAERDPGLAAQAQDTKWDLPGGAAGIGFTYERAARTETMEEYGASKSIVDRLVLVGYIETNRLRGSIKLGGDPEKEIRGIVREKIAVYIMPVKYNESSFVCSEKKPLYLSDRRGGEIKVEVPKNRAYPLVTVDELITELEDGKHLKDGKRLSVLCALLHHGLIQDSDPRLEKLIERILRDPLKLKKVHRRKKHKTASLSVGTSAKATRKSDKKLRKRRRKQHNLDR